VRSRVDIRQDDGVALVLVVLLISVLMILAVTLMDSVRGETNRSAQSVRSVTAFQAAEAGIDDYIAKLVADTRYYDHYVHPAESTRRTSTGTTVAAGADEVTWPGGSWSYPNGKDRFNAKTLDNGYEYNLQVFPPGIDTTYVKVIATGRRIGSTTDQRAIEVWVRPAVVSDFQLLTNADVTYGPTATSYGKLYVTGWNTGQNRWNNLTHNGTARGNLYAEGRVLGSTTLQNGATKFDSTTNPDIRTEIKERAEYNNFVVALEDVKKAARDAGGMYLNQPYDGWEITPRASGQYRVRRCTRANGNDLARTAPNCTSSCTGCGTFTVPTNGAIYAEQPVIVSGASEQSVVDGRVTIATASDLIVGNNIRYETSGDDVLGLVANNNIIVASWAPSTFDWRAATLAQNGQWRSWNNCECKSKATFTGSEVSNQGGYMNMFAVREYFYDDTLSYLQPPWFPTLGGAITILLFREVTP
jgi:hypothetical protein